MLQWLQRPPSLMIAIAYALATVVFAFFVMQPGMGAGLATVVFAFFVMQPGMGAGLAVSHPCPGGHGVKAC